ncbi:MAG: hypothetical protein LBN06_10270 [Prevotellaceae bacterium]|jgi:hypothetical protein|nr:hypothetical protein [Prevotellaceae bacterium]
MPHCFPHIARRALLRLLLTILLTGSAAPLFAQVTLKTPSNLHEVVEYEFVLHHPQQICRADFEMRKCKPFLSHVFQ